MNFWREDPEGMDKEIVKAMIVLECASSRKSHDEILLIFNGPQFQRSKDFLRVANHAEESYGNRLVSTFEARAEGNR